MNIKDLKEGMKNVTLKNVKIIDIGETREFEKYGKPGRVATATLEDSTGTVLCPLWNAQIDDFEIGEVISIINGYVSEFGGKLQISTGKTGNIVRGPEEERVE